MSYRHMWGFGGVTLECGGYTASFDRAIGELRFDPIQNSYTTLNQSVYNINFGWRVHIEFEAINTSCGDTYTTHRTLMNVLNAHYYGGSPLTIYPRYSTTDPNLAYVCHLSGSVDYESLAAVKAAQRIRLAFDSVDPVYALPTLTSDMVRSDLLTLGMDTLVTLDGEKLQSIGE